MQDAVWCTVNFMPDIGHNHQLSIWDPLDKLFLRSGRYERIFSRLK